jgi:hypothetical protein
MKLKIKTHKGYKRDEQVKQGMFDGRFRHRVVLDKKKQESKMKCRRGSW